jgi:uncharacterized protein (DUF2267 family)
MGYDEFIEVVAKMIGGDHATAEEATRATLGVLAERVGSDESLVLVDRLPPELGPMLYTPGGAVSFDAEEFVRRVADPLRVDPATAERHAEAVLAALARVLDDTEYRHIVSRLSRDYAPLLPKGAYAGAVPLDELIARVGERALRVTEAVLETLAERIASGDVEDLLTRLPVALHGPLKRGRARAGDKSHRMPATEFVRRVAERAGQPPEETPRYIRAVFTALRRAVGEEFYDITVQLPDEYRQIIGA